MEKSVTVRKVSGSVLPLVLMFKKDSDRDTKALFCKDLLFCFVCTDVAHA